MLRETHRARLCSVPKGRLHSCLRKMLTEEIRSSLAARPCKAAVGQSLQAGSSVDLVSSPFKRWAFVLAHSIFGPIVKQNGAEDVWWKEAAPLAGSQSHCQ